MSKPKPITVSSAASTRDYGAPQPFLLVIPGYDPAKAQTLEHDATGVIRWVDKA